MTRKEALRKLEDLLEEHRPDPVIGCDCMPYVEGSKEYRKILQGSWEKHVAEIVLDAAKGF